MAGSTLNPSTSFLGHAQRDDADAGDLHPFTVVHKGGGETSNAMSTVEARNLPDDFIVAKTPCSGYQTKEGSSRECRQAAERAPY